MKSRRLAFLAISLLPFFPHVLSYKIDQSCRDEGVYEIVENGLHGAFEMAEIAREALKRSQNPQKPWGKDVPPRDPELQALIANVFAHECIRKDNCPTVAEAQRQKYKFQQNMRNVFLERPYDVYRRVLENFRTATDNPKSEDVIIYCNDARFAITTEPGIIRNKKWSLDRSNGIKLEYKEQLCYGDSPSTLAMTWGRPVHPTTRARFPTSIQLCKDFVKFIKEGKITTLADMKTKTKLSRISSKLVEHSKLGFRQIDAFNLLEVTLLHEMSHAPNAQDLKDVRIRGMLTFWRNKEAYGWPLIKLLASKGPYLDRGSPTAPDNNADSVAYFALGCKLMSDPNNPQRVTQAGSLERIDSGPVNWRPDRWFTLDLPPMRGYLQWEREGTLENITGRSTTLRS